MYILMALVLFTFAFTTPKSVHFNKTEHDFGTIAQGVPQKAIFILTNKSEETLILKNVKGSCGCTATSYSTEAIPAGSTTEIEATFNAKSPGAFLKTVSVYTNLEEEPFILTVKGTVESSNL